MKKQLLLFLLFISAMMDGNAAKPPKPNGFEMTRGVNISHWLSQSSVRGEQRAQYFTRDDVAFIASLGFDHIRFPIDEEQMFDEQGNKEKEAFALLHNALKWCAEFNLRAVVDLHILRTHHFNAEEKPLFTQEAAQEQFYDCWRKISGELKKYPLAMVAYELMNEPVADEPEIWNVIVNRCASAVRKLEPRRTIVIGSNRWQAYNTVKDLRVPDNDPNIIISFHYYNPFLLTHYRASWTDNRNYRGPIHYPGKQIADEDLAGLTQQEAEKFGWANNKDQIYNIDRIESDFLQVLQVAKDKGLKVYCGEYGCIDDTPKDDTNRWFRDMNTLFERHGIARAVWDYKGGFGIVKRGETQWAMIEALTGRRGDASQTAFALHPDNPRYFIFRGKPTLLITCGEHYGALLNGAFDFDKYFRALQRDGLNHSRVFSGVYLEDHKSFNIIDNTLAPQTAKDYVSPWATLAEGKYDLTKWNPAYFERLHQLVQTASERGIVLEITLFCPMYDNSLWNISPMNSRNNVNGIGTVAFDKVHTLDGDLKLLAVQEQFARKMAETLNGYDNFYFEICNEPYFGGVSQDWQKRITDVIVDTEQSLPKKHLISVNAANGTARVENPHPAWALFNFHYCTPPSAIADNASLNLPIGMNETGFNGLQDEYYRREAWAFMLSGGALYNHLDYSFAVGKEDGTNIVRKPTPGGGSLALRRQIAAMKRFIEQFDFLKLKPLDSSHVKNILPSDCKAYILAEDNRQYLAYGIGKVRKLDIPLPAGNYRLFLLNPKNCESEMIDFQHSGGSYTLRIPDKLATEDEVAVGFVRKEN